MGLLSSRLPGLHRETLAHKTKIPKPIKQQQKKLASLKYWERQWVNFRATGFHFNRQDLISVFLISDTNLSYQSPRSTFKDRNDYTGTKNLQMVRFRRKA